MVSRISSKLSLPPLHPALEQYRAALEAVAKPAWLLRCRKVNTVSRSETHFGGITPFVPVHDGWPSCDKCGEKLHFVWQVNFAEIDGCFSKRGLFQFFYCWRCYAGPADDFGHTCRWYPNFEASQANGIPQLNSPYEVNMASYHLPIGPCAVDVVPFLSVPGKSSQENPIPVSAQNEMVSAEDGRLWSVYSSTKGFYLEEEKISRVGGYPPWVQFHDETPNCPICGTRAEFVGAIGSEDTNLIWGDSGYWYFFACKATVECYGLARPLMASQCY
jgi:hypothetical protein